MQLSKTEKSTELFRSGRSPGGGDRVRTDDLLVANQLLSQLSYAPRIGFISWWG